MEVVRKKDWYPGRKAEQIAMGMNWVTALMSAPPPVEQPGPGTPLSLPVQTREGAAPPPDADPPETKAAEWNIPAAAVDNLAALVNEARAAFKLTSSEATRTKVTVAECQTALKKMTDAMRSMKRLHLQFEVLGQSGYALMGLPQPDTTKTPAKTPTAQVSVETFLSGRNQLGIIMVYLVGNPKDKENKGYRVFYKLTPAGSPLPLVRAELANQFFTKKLKDVLELPPESAGMNCTLCACVENNDRPGPLGPLTTALVP